MPTIEISRKTAIMKHIVIKMARIRESPVRYVQIIHENLLFVQSGGKFMKEFEIRIKSVQDVLSFVDLATSRPFAVLVGNDTHRVNGKSFMEMFCLNFARPLKATMDCSEEEFEQFRRDADALLAK